MEAVLAKIVVRIVEVMVMVVVCWRRWRRIWICRRI
jgi:hypothetical protein